MRSDGGSRQNMYKRVVSTRLGHRYVILSFLCNFSLLITNLQTYTYYNECSRGNDSEVEQNEPKRVVSTRLGHRYVTYSFSL